MGTPVVYTAGSLALALLEQFVHFDVDLMPESLVSIPVDIPDGVVVEEPPVRGNFDSDGERMRFGDAWTARALSAILKVQPVIVPEEFNYVLNPRHGRR